MFVGFSRTQRGYRCFHPPTKRYFISADVTFFESQVYFDGTTSDVEYPPLSFGVEPFTTKEIESTIINNEMLCPLQVYCRRQQTQAPPSTEPSSSMNVNQPSTSSDLPIALQKGIRSSTTHPISNFVSYDSFHPIFRSFVLSLSSESISKNYQETLLLSHWKAAMDEEIASLTSHGTWKLVTRPVGSTIVTYRWVYIVKHKVDGTIDRYKTRLVAQSLTKTYDIDYA